MKKVIILACILIIVARVKARGEDTLFLKSSPVITYSVLPGSNYSFNQVLTGTLPFITNDSLRLSNNKVFWLKVFIYNPAHFTREYSIKVNPDAYNTYYYFDDNLQQWVSQAAGELPPNGHDASTGGARHILMQPKDTNIVFVKVDLSMLRHPTNTIRPVIVFEREDKQDKKEQVLVAAWIVSASILVFFFINNLFLYYSFRDKSILFYLVAQVGGFLYVTGYRVIAPHIPINFSLLSNGTLSVFDINALAEHIGVMLSMFGLVRFALKYLDTKKHLPRMHMLLRGAMYFYLVEEVIVINVFSFSSAFGKWPLIADNVLLMVLISLMMATAIAAYRNKLQASRIFLLAYSLPLCLMITITVFHVFMNKWGEDNIIPNIAICCEALVFSVALVARTRLIQQDLREKELEAQQLAFELKETALQRNLIELENQKINVTILHEKSKNDLLQQKLEANQRELASTTLYMVQKNELLARLRSEIEELNKLHPNKDKQLPGIASILKSDLYLDDDWNRFKLHFEQVHPRFFEELLSKYPALTKNETRLYAYFHINLSTKEIAALLNIAPASVRRAKTRLYKKIGQSYLLSSAELTEDD